MAKDYGGLVFYRTKEGKLRYFDPNKAKTPEGKAKIKAIRSGKSKNAFIGSKDTIKNEVRKQANVERAKAEENARLANNKYSKAVTKAGAEREDIIAARKKKSQADNKARQALNEQRRVNDPIDYGRNERDKLNVQRAQKKADERKKPAWVKNPNFNYKKYGKYFDDKGVLKKETADEYFKAYAQTRKSADGIREKEANEKLKRETFRKATEAVNAKKTNKEKWLEAKSELKRAQDDVEQFNDKESKERLAKAQANYEKTLKAYTEERWENNTDRLKDDFAKAREGSKKAHSAGVAARKEKANWENEFDKQAKEADKQVNSIDKLDDWTKKQIEPVKNLSSEETKSRYEELRNRAQKGGYDALSKEEHEEYRALANRLQDKGTGKLKDVLEGKQKENKSSPKEKIKWKKTPYGFSEADYKGFTITKGQYYATGMSDDPNEITVDFGGDDAYFDSIEEAMKAIDRETESKPAKQKKTAWKK